MYLGINIYKYIYRKTQGFRKRGSLVGIILAEQCFFYCTCTISMKNILETLFLIQNTLGLEFGMTFLTNKKKEVVD